MLGDQQLDLRHHVTVPAPFEVGLQAPLDREHPQLLEPRDRDVERRLIREIRERRPPPQRERSGERRGRLVPPLVAQLPRTLLGENLELVEVERARGDVEHVAGAARLDHLFPQRLPQARHVALDEVRGRRRRLIAPEAVDDPAHRHERVRRKQEQRERRTLFPAAQIQRAAVASCLERAEHAVIDVHGERP